MKELKIRINKEVMKSVGDKSLRLGKTIVVEGVKSLAEKTAAKVITTGFSQGMDGVKETLKFDSIVGPKKEKVIKEKTDKKKWFSKKGKTEETIGESETDVEVTVDNDSKELVITVEATDVE